LFYGKVLRHGNWRLLFKAASVVQVFALVVAVVLRNTFKNNLNSSITSTNTFDDQNESMKEVVARVTKSEKFWFMLTGKVALMVVGQFISFIPLFLITGLGLPNSQAATASSVFSFGSLIASILIARFYQKLESKQQIDVVLVSNIISSIIGIFLTIQTLVGGLRIPVVWSLFALFLWGGTWAMSFYTPPGVVALQLGGKKHAALLTNIFDAIGYLAAAVFSYYATGMGRDGKWTSILVSLSLCSITASFTMLKAMRIPYIGSKVHD